MAVTRQTDTTHPAAHAGGCVVMVRETAQAPNALLNALRSRGLPPVVAHDGPGVMTALAELDDRRRVLVIVEPVGWVRLAELVQAVRTYHPDVLCWQFGDQDQGGQRLTLLDQSLSGPVFAGGMDDGPVGHIGRRRRTVDQLLVKVPGRPLTSREIVTQQELTMLLGPAPGEAG